VRRAAIVAVVALVALEIALLLGVGRRDSVPVPAIGDFQKGIVFGLFAREEPGYASRSLREIRSLGADSVSIVLPWVTPDVRSTRLAPRGDMTPSDASLRRCIREAHALGLRVFLLPLVYVDVMRGEEWRGALDPPDWDAWFRSYRRMILHYAAMAEDEGVEYLSVGSELCSSEARREAWLGIISSVRGAYRGRLTYSANWDHLESLSFVDALDFVGMNAYFELSPDPDPGSEALEEAWKEIRGRVESWRSRIGKPLVFTEVGYPSRRGAASRPWDYDAKGTPDAALQERCYRAFVRTWTGADSLAGVYFYLWWGDGGPDDAGYTPRGKPAASVLSDWYLGRGAGESR